MNSTAKKIFTCVLIATLGFSASCTQGTSQRDSSEVTTSSRVSPRESVLNSNQTAEEIYNSTVKDTKSPANFSKLAKITSATLLDLDSTSAADDFARASALLEGISKDSRASATVLQEVGSPQILRTISIAALKSIDEDKEKATLLAHNTRTLFQVAEPAVAQADPEQSRVLARNIATVLREPNKVALPSSYAPYALSYLLSDSLLSTPFLTELGKELESFEQDLTRHASSWHQISAPATNGPALFPDEFKAASFDPMAAYFTSLGRNNEAALQFFQGSSPSENLATENALQRQKYWIAEREWRHDGFIGIFSALDAATTGENAGTPQGSALASTVFELLGHRTRKTPDSKKFTAPEENLPLGSLNPTASQHLVHFLGTYLPSIDFYTERNDFSFPKSLAGKTAKLRRLGLLFDHMPVFNPENVEPLLALTLASDEGFASMRLALNNYKYVHFHQVAQYRSSKSSDKFQEIFDRTVSADASIEAIFHKLILTMPKEIFPDPGQRLMEWQALANELPRPNIKNIEKEDSKVAFLSAQEIAVRSTYLSSAREHISTTYRPEDYRDESSRRESNRRMANNGLYYAEMNRFAICYYTGLLSANAVKSDIIKTEEDRTPYWLERFDIFFKNGRVPTIREVYEEINSARPVGETKILDFYDYLIQDYFKKSLDKYKETERLIESKFKG